MSYRLNLSTGPTVEPVTLAEAKLHLRVDNSDEDALITALIQAAREQAEAFTRRAFISQTWEMFLDAFPPESCPIFLPRSPIISLDSIAYTDTDGDAQVLAATVYKVDQATSVPARVTVKDGQSYPDTLGEADVVTITFTAGYGATAADVPASIKAAILLMVGHLFENREAVATGVSVAEVPLAWKHLLTSYRIYEAPVSP